MNSKIRVIKTDVVKGDFLKEEPALRFKKDASVPDGIELEVVNVYDEMKYQEILGRVFLQEKGHCAEFQPDLHQFIGLKSRVGIIHYLSQNALSDRKQLETAGILRSACCYCFKSVGNIQRIRLEKGKPA